MEYRRHETPRLWFRTGRVFRSDGAWYFSTREGVSVGPYQTQFEAEVESDLLKHQLRELEPERALSAIREFMLESRDRELNLNDRSFTDYVLRERPTQLTLGALFGTGEGAGS